MQFFYVPQVKKYILIGAVIGFSIGLLLRIFFSSFPYQELLLHHTIRQKLGFPQMLYITPVNVMIFIFYQLLYTFSGAVSGMIYFKIRYRHAGLTLLTTQALRTITGIFICVFLYFFLYADIFTMLYPLVEKNAIQPIAKLVGYAFKTPKFSDDMFRLVPSYPPAQRNPYVPQPQPNPPPYTNPQPQPPVTTMPSPSEIVGALNNYRAKNGLSAFTQDDFLMGYAQQRAQYFVSRGGLDNHDQFFKDIRDSRFNAYYSLGENSASSGTMTAEKLIEEFFGRSSGHNDNQLSTQWTHVGVGVSGSYTDVVFGRK